MQKASERKPDPARDFLSSAREAKIEYTRIRRRIAELESQATKCTASLSGMPGGGGGGGMESLWAALADERRNLTLAAEEELNRYHAVDRFIRKLDDPVHRIVLRLHYLDGFRWPQVQKEMEKEGYYYCERHITRLHGEALKEARRIWRDQGGVHT